MNLFEINQQIRDILNSADDEGVITDDAFAELDKLNIALEIKHEAYGCLIKEFSATAKMLKDEADKLSGRQKVYENKAAKLRERLSASMLANYQEKLETAKVYITFKKSTATVIDDWLKIPQQYIKTKTEPDISAIKEALQDGTTVPGARLEVRQNIQVR